MPDAPKIPTSQHDVALPAKEASGGRQLISAAAWTGVILIIAGMFGLAYVYRSEPGLDPAVAERRIQIRNEVVARQTATLNEYARAGEVIRIPVERAMEYALPRLNAKVVGPAPAAPQGQPDAQQTPQAAQESQAAPAGQDGGQANPQGQPATDEPSAQTQPAGQDQPADSAVEAPNPPDEAAAREAAPQQGNPPAEASE